MIVPEYSAEQESWPRVTSVLEACGLVDYSAIPSGIREAALQRGTDVHMISDSIDRGEADYWSEDPELSGYARAWVAFKAGTGFRPTEVEAKVVHPERRYRGRLDRVGMIGDQLYILDIKSGIVAEWVRIQLAAYLSCLPEPWKYKRIGVQLRKDGRFTVSKPFDNLRGDQDFFFSAVNVVHARSIYGRAFVLEDAA